VPRLTPAQQRAAAAAYVAGAVRLLLDGDLRVLPMFDGGRVEVPSAGDVDVRSTAIGGDRVLRRFSPTQSVTDGGARARLCLGYSNHRSAPWCGAGFASVRSPHWPDGGPHAWVAPAPARWALEVAWEGAGRAGGVRFTRPWDLRGAGTLDARTIVDPAKGAVRLGLRLTDATGRAATLSPETARLDPLPGPGPVLGRMWAQTLRAPLQGVGGIDLSRIVGVEVVGLSPDGRVWLLDLVGHRARLPEVVPQRLPVVSMRSVSRREGDGSGAQALAVPMRVSGVSAAPGRVRVVFTDPRAGRRLTRTVRLAPGQTAASASVPYRADRRDDPLRTAWNVVAYPISGVTTGRYHAVATVLDDDPAPRVRVTRARVRVAEGRTARWKVVLSARTDYDVAVFAKVVRGSGSSGRRLSTSDVPRRWLCSHGRCPGRRMPLWRHGVFLDERIPRGRRSATLAIPTLRDRRAEGRRLVTVRVQLYHDSGRLGRVVERTVEVVD